MSTKARQEVRRSGGLQPKSLGRELLDPHNETIPNLPALNLKIPGAYHQTKTTAQKQRCSPGRGLVRQCVARVDRSKSVLMHLHCPISPSKLQVLVHRVPGTCALYPIAKA